MRTKHFFNLIEIALATAVIAIGLSSLMVLFPVGLNASRDAAADNIIPDVADYVLGSLQLYITKDWRDANGKAVALGTPLPTTEPLTSDLLSDGEDKVEIANIPMTPTDLPTNEKIKVIRLGNFLYQQKNPTTNLVEFSAFISVWTEQVPAVNFLSSYALGAYPNDRAIALCMKISWPAEKPDTAREARYYRLDMFNPGYNK